MARRLRSVRWRKISSRICGSISRAAELTEERWEATLLAAAMDLLLRQDVTLTVQIAVRRCLDRLRSRRALAWARQNVALDSDIGTAAVAMIAGIAETSDAPRLHELLVEAVHRGNDHIYAQCDLVAGLARVGHVNGVATVEAIFDSTVYSYLRTRCAESLSTLAPDFADERAIECLDDCESGTRAIGIAHANMLKPAVRDRVGQIAEDLSEDDDNRLFAATRIVQHP